MDADPELFTDGFLTGKATTYSAGYGLIISATFPEGENPLNPNAVRGIEVGGGTPTLGVTKSVGNPTNIYVPFIGTGRAK